MSAKAIYREFSSLEKTLPIFSLAWWLDAAVGPDAWDLAGVTESGELVAAMPYVLCGRYALRSVIAYMRYGVTMSALETMTEPKNAVRKVNGNFSPSWHNSYLESHEARMIYKEIIR